MGKDGGGIEEHVTFHLVYLVTKMQGEKKIEGKQKKATKRRSKARKIIQGIYSIPAPMFATSTCTSGEAYPRGCKFSGPSSPGFLDKAPCQNSKEDGQESYGFRHRPSSFQCSCVVRLRMAAERRACQRRMVKMGHSLHPVTISREQRIVGHGSWLETSKLRIDVRRP